MRTTIDVPEPILRSAKRRAAERRVTLSAVVTDALRADLAGKKSAPAAPFELITFKGRLVQPDLDLNRTSEIFMEDDTAAFKALRLKRRKRAPGA